MKKFIIPMLFFCQVLYCQGENVQNGYAKILYGNGQISSEGNMINGKPDGYWRTYYVNGVKKSEGNRRNFLLDSTWIFYDEKGDTTEKINYVLGKKNGYHFKYEVSTVLNIGNVNYLKSKELFVNDKREGLSYYYFENNTINEIINFKNGKKNGTGKEFNSKGQIITLYEFFNDYMIDKQYVNRYNEKGFKQGKWIDLYENGKVRSEKTFENDTINGYLKEYKDNGDLSIALVYDKGNLKQPEKSEEFTLEEKIDYHSNGNIKRKGFYRKEIPIGIHKFYNEEGKITNSKIFSDAGIVLSEGFLTEDGKKEGYWKNFYENGEVRSEGNFKNNRQIGEWKFLFSAGKPEQIGNFSNGSLDGEWKWFYRDGRTLRFEEYLSGKREGKFVEFNEHGDTITFGNFIEGEKEGDWILKVGDFIERGKYAVGLKEGIWKEYYLNGVLKQEGNYIQGIPDGKFFNYYENGKIKEEQFYVNGIKEKVWKKYDEMGVIAITIAYENNLEKKINGVKVAEVKSK